jgi:hypothetical protein
LICADYEKETIIDLESFLFCLIAPRSSHMDFNIGLALHLASKGEGMLCMHEKFFLSEEFKEAGKVIANAKKK